jgi:hypothetical protein
MPIENRDLELGTKLTARYRGQAYTGEVIGSDSGLRYRLEDRREFASSSAAGGALMNGTTCNGWRFWSVYAEGAAAESPPRAAGPPLRDVIQGALERGFGFTTVDRYLP